MMAMTTRRAIVRWTLRMAIVLSGGLLPFAERGDAATATPPDTSCQASTTSGSASYSGAALQAAATSFTNTTFVAATNSIDLVPGALVVETPFTIPASGPSEEQLKWGCAADFDGDGFPDLIGVKKLKNVIGFYKNNSAVNVPTPAQWGNATYTRPPVFLKPASYIYSNTSGTTTAGSEKVQIACGDFDKDGKQDFFYLRGDNPVYSNNGDTFTQTTPTVAIFFKGAGNGTFTQTSYANWFSTNTALTHGYKASINQSGQMQAIDVNGDGYLDLVVPVVMEANQPTQWAVEVYLNNHASPPSFTFDSTRFIYAPTGSGKCSGGSFNKSAWSACESGAVGLVFKNLDGDSGSQPLDLLVGVRAFASIGAYSDAAYALLTPSTAYFTMATSGATLLSPGILLAGDFSMTGRQDIVAGFSDAIVSGGGGQVVQWANTGAAWGAAPPFPAAGLQIGAPQATRKNITSGFVLNYDQDPYTTDDFMMWDGDNGGSAASPTYYMFATRRNFPPTGNATSVAVDLGALAGQDIAVTGVRMKPTVTLNGGTLGFEASNDDGATYHPATPCTDDTTAYCVTFDTTAGAKLHWRATYQANANQDNGPSVSKVDVTYQYVAASNHFRASPVERDGVIYAGAFSEPGDGGHLYAINDSDGVTLWDGGAKLDLAASRNVFTASAANTLLTFSPTSPPAALITALQASSAAEATSIVNYMLSKRFGVSIPRTLGAIVNSTPAVLSPAGTPYWYSLATTTTVEKTAITSYVLGAATRPVLVFAGSKDGAVHAFRSNPKNASDPTNGTEAWAFIPYDVAQRMKADYVAKTPSAYPDGSPTLVDAKVAGVWRTLLVSGEGSGGRAVFALDVTNTVDAAGVVTPPIPLWSFSNASAGSNSNLGYTFSKPTVIRINKSGTEMWLAVFASGKGPTGTNVGSSVYAVDLATGALVWRFDTGDPTSYISTDIVAAETVDPDTGGTPAYDGYIDRLFFADSKGRVWKLDPAAFSGTSISSLGTVAIPGLTNPALFSTLLTPSALGDERAIAGSIAAIRDTVGHLILYVATGGTVETPSTASPANAVFAIDADTGQVTLDGLTALSFGGAQGVPIGAKFYGGVVYNGSQIIVAASTDSINGGLCEATTGQIYVLDAGDFSQQYLIDNVAIGSAMRAPVFVRNGQLYTATSDGKIVTTAYTGIGHVGTGPQMLNPNGTLQQTTFHLIGWRQL
jgi:hypothetical protein